MTNAPEPFPSWGRLSAAAAAEYLQKAPGVVFFPGIAISLAIFGANLLAETLRDTKAPTPQSLTSKPHGRPVHLTPSFSCPPHPSVLR